MDGHEAGVFPVCRPTKAAGCAYRFDTGAFRRFFSNSIGAENMIGCP